jgi:serine/threonine protein kinase/TolB-like protein/Tfp pilus assembly protein PilF
LHGGRPTPYAVRTLTEPMDRRGLDRWNRVKSVFSDALDRSPSERPAFVAEACGDDASMRRDVESLLDSDRQAGSFIETPAAALLGQAPLEQSALPDLTPGTLLGPYEILGFVGAGGMSQVYRARDSRLGRIVAIKVVGGAGSDPRAERRLLREARHASSLAHPYICTIHEVDEAAGRPFIVMEYVSGRTLRDLVRNGSVELPDLLRLGIQIADALDHAHQRGVIHRDLKSANVVVAADGPAKVLDFGLSTRLPDPATNHTSMSAVTETATVAGTLSHMAPEVLLGHQPNPKGDIWALGVLLYEMASGKLPFKGETPFETSSGILHANPAPLPSRVPLALRLVIQRCLEKDPNRRYQTASEVHLALEAVERRERLVLTGRLLLRRYGRRLAVVSGVAAIVTAVLVGIARREQAAAPTAGQIQTVAVLPLANVSNDSAQDYFTEGMTETLIGSMGKIDGVRVLSRTTVMKYRGSSKAPQDVGRELGADAVLDGSVRREGERLRVQARLTSASTGQILWSDSYDRSLREAPAVENDIVRAVAASGAMRMTNSARTRLSATRAVDPDVYEAYLKGRYYWNQRSEVSIKTAITYFDRAIALDPTYAPPYAAVADCYNQLATLILSTGSPQEWRPKAAAAAIKALQIDPELAEAHATLGYVRHYEWQWTDAEREFTRAIELNPSYALAHVWYANLLGSRRRFAEALREVLLARDLDPLSLIVNTNVGWVLNMARRYHEAIVQLERTLKLDPNYQQAHRRLADAYGGVGRFDEAIAEQQVVVKLSDNNPSSLGGLAHLYAKAGRPAEARRILGDLLIVARTRYVSPGLFASIYLALGEADLAFPWIERAYREQSNYMAYIAVDDTRDAVGADPRYRDLLRRVGLD